MQFPFNRKVFLASAVAITTQASFVQGAGFTIHEQSASSMGTAFAGRASYAEDASIGAANPAGIAFLDSQQATVGMAVIIEGGNFEGSYTGGGAAKTGATTGTSDGFLKTTPIPFGHYVLPINDQFTFGLNAYVPFGLNLDYDDKFAGRYFGDKTLIKNGNLQSTFAYKIQDDLSIGIGLTASYFEGELTKRTHVPLGGGNYTGSNLGVSIKGDDLAYTWNVGVVWQLDADTSMGASYHAATKFTLEGSSELTDAGANNFKHDAELTVRMPERFMFSMNHQLNEQWIVMADAVWTRWSRLDSITIVDKEDEAKNMFVPMGWKDVWAVSLGAAYKMNDELTLKGGYMFDASPTTDKNRTVRAPDNDRNWLTVGAKWDATQDMTFDFSAAYVMLQNGKITESYYDTNGNVSTDYGTLTGKYKNQSSFILSAQMTYRF